MCHTVHHAVIICDPEPANLLTSGGSWAAKNEEGSDPLLFEKLCLVGWEELQ